MFRFQSNANQNLNIANNLLADRNDDRGDDKQKRLNFKLVKRQEKKRDTQTHIEFFMIQNRSGEIARSEVNYLHFDVKYRFIGLGLYIIR